MSRFSDFPYFMLNDFIGNNTSTSSTNSDNLKGCRLMGPKTGIVVGVQRSSSEVYIKLSNGYTSGDNITDKGYMPIELRFDSMSINDNNMFQFNVGSYRDITTGNALIYSDTVGALTNTKPIPLGLQGVDSGGVGNRNNLDDLLFDDTGTVPTYRGGYFRINYNYLLDYNLYTNELSHISTDGTSEVYFRKDSSFCNWLRDSASSFYKLKYGIDFDVRRYVNLDRDYLFFGYISKVNSRERFYTVTYHGIKDYVEGCLPVNNRTPKLMEFMCDNFFDKQYTSNYHMLKDVWSMIDPHECDDRWLFYIGRYYGFNHATTNMSNRRDFLNKIVYYLKRKGTNESLVTLFKILSGDSNNVFSITEKWMGRTTDLGYWLFLRGSDNSTPAPKGGMGTRWYYDNFYKPDRPIYNVSTNSYSYKGNLDVIRRNDINVMTDISDIPIGKDELIPEKYITGFINSAEELRPINKIFLYSTLLSILTHKQLTTSQIDQYNKQLVPGLVKTYVYVNSYTVEGLYNNFYVSHESNTLYPYLKVYYRDNAGVYQYIDPSLYIVNIVDESNLSISMTMTSLDTIFTKNYIKNINIRVDISKGELSDGASQGQFISTTILNNTNVPNRLKFGYTDVNTGIHHKCYNININPPNPTTYDFGDYKVSYLSGVEGTPTFRSGVREYNTSTLVQPNVLSVTGPTYETVEFIFIPSNYPQITGDIIIEEISLYNTTVGNFDMRIRTSYIYVPYNTDGVNILIKIFYNKSDLDSYITNRGSY